MAFPPEFLDQIRARVPLSDVVGRHVRLIKRGPEWIGLCPFHGEKTPSFTVSEGKGFYHCFGCGAHGDAIAFLMQREGLPFHEAVERLAAEAGLPLPRSAPEEQAAASLRTDLHRVLELATSWFEEQLRSRDGRAARVYLEGRGLSEATIATFRLGYAPERRGMFRAALNAKGVGDDLLAQAGLIKWQEDSREPRDYFFNRITFPISDRSGRVIAFGGRALGQSPAKYLNSPDTPLFHKGRVLYNLARARRTAHEGGTVIVAEGYMDVIALSEAGFAAAVAPLGTAITADQIRELWRLAPEPVLCLDGDDAGRGAGIRAAERALPLLQPGYSLRFALLPAAEDPDSFVRSQGVEALHAALNSARPLADLLWLKETEGKSFDTPERRTGLRKRLLKAVQEIRDKDVRDAYKSELQHRWEQAFGYAPSRPGGAVGPRRAGGGGMARSPLRGLGAMQSPHGLRLRQEQMLLAGLINHPSLLPEHAEELSALTLDRPEFDRMRRALVDLAAMEQALDTSGVRRHLSEQGFDRALNALLREDVYKLAPFARPTTAIEQAGQEWRHVFDLYVERKARERGARTPDLAAAKSRAGHATTGSGRGD